MLPAPPVNMRSSAASTISNTPPPANLARSILDRAGVVFTNWVSGSCDCLSSAMKVVIFRLLQKAIQMIISKLFFSFAVWDT
jgi:hypothetical protein